MLACGAVGLQPGTSCKFEERANSEGNARLSPVEVVSSKHEGMSNTLARLDRGSCGWPGQDRARRTARPTCRRDATWPDGADDADLNSLSACPRTRSGSQ